MITGALLLARARTMTPAELNTTFASGAEADANRASVLAVLVQGFGPPDVEVIRALTRFEATAVERADDGCGDALLAGCWMLFVLGDVRDSALVWRAKNLNFDCHCFIDSVLLLPQGLAATQEFAAAEGPADLAEWVASSWVTAPDEEIAGWRKSTYFRGAPSASSSVADLAGWLRS